MMRMQTTIIFSGLLLLSGCAPGVFAPFAERSAAVEQVALSDPQSCAIGYDLAKSIYEALPAGRTEIGVRKASGECERHAIEYLRRSGFAISETGGVPFTVETRALGAVEVLAVGRVGAGLSVSRIYELAPMGVYPVTPATLKRTDNTARQRAAIGPRRRPQSLAPRNQRGDR